MLETRITRLYGDNDTGRDKATGVEVLNYTASKAPIVVGALRHWPARSAAANPPWKHAPIAEDPDKPDPQPAASETVRMSVIPKIFLRKRRARIFRGISMRIEVSQQNLTLQFLLDVSALSTDERFECVFLDIKGNMTEIRVEIGLEKIAWVYRQLHSSAGQGNFVRRRLIEIAPRYPKTRRISRAQCSRVGSIVTAGAVGSNRPEPGGRSDTNTFAVSAVRPK